MKDIVDAVLRECAAAGSNRRELLSQRRDKSVVQRRHIAYLVLHEAGLSYPAIGRALGDRDHTTILHGARRARQLIRDHRVCLALYRRATMAVEALTNGGSWQPTPTELLQAEERER